MTGVDTSPTLVSLCRDRLPKHNWLAGDMRTLQLGRRFDRVLAWDSSFHLKPDDQRAMFSVFARHAKPSATLMFNSGPAYGESVGEYQGDPLYHASLNPDEYQALLGRAGFAVVDHIVEDWQNAGGRTVWLATAAGGDEQSRGPPRPRGRWPAPPRDAGRWGAGTPGKRRGL